MPFFGLFWSSFGTPNQPPPPTFPIPDFFFTYLFFVRLIVVLKLHVRLIVVLKLGLIVVPKLVRLIVVLKLGLIVVPKLGLIVVPKLGRKVPHSRKG